MKKIAIIGGGPSALMLAAQLDKDKYRVKLFEKKKAVGRKFLVAGEGGLNLTYNSSLGELISQYHPSEFMDPIIRLFTKDDLRSWFTHKGIPTFVGSSNRVFPDLELKPIEILNNIVQYLLYSKVEFVLEKNWIGWNEKGQLCFEKDETEEFNIVVFALGGASWKVTGSDGTWSNIFEKRGLKVKPFRAANCAFAVDWNKNFVNVHEGKPLKNIALSYEHQIVKGELTITKFGLEGNAIYALSQKIQDTLLEKESVIVYLDLKPTMTVDQIETKLNNTQLQRTTDTLKEDINLDRSSIGLLKQFSDKETFLDHHLLAEVIKSVPIVLNSADELDKAISSLGGLALEEIDEHFQLKKIPNSYAIGEMLDWFAPTGGYLLQGCFSMGFMLAQYLNEIENEE